MKGRFRPSLPSVLFVALAGAWCLANATRAAAPVGGSVVVESPDRDVRVEFGLYDRGGESAIPCYSVSFRGKMLVREASLGVELRPSGPLRSHLLVSHVARRDHDETYSLFPGKASRARDHYREATVSLEEQSGSQRRFDLLFRAYDDGAAFRYRFPKQPGLTDLNLTEERSTFAVAGNPKAYTLPVPSYTTPYEFYYQPRPLESVPANTLLALPLLLEYPDHTSLAITEADLTDYAGMYLAEEAGASGVLASRLSPRPGEAPLKVRAALPHDTPWRVLMVGTSPGALIESNLITNLNPPSVIKDTSWIHPDKTTFPWWNGYAVGDAGFTGGMNTQTMKHYIDFCAEQGIKYHSLDGLNNVAWYGGPIVPYRGAEITQSIPEIDLPEVLRYARQKGVRLRLWMNSAAARAKMATAFPIYEKWGIEGVMVDFVERDDQDAINFIHDLVALAAKHHLTVTLHNISKPTGLTRTYPNLLTLESVLNLEFDKWDPKGSTPEHELIVPFTRMLAGPLDYHSGSFRHVTEQQFKPRDVAPVTVGTRARQLARYVVYEDYLPMVADYPNAYRNQPGLELLTHIPTYWDETRVLNGEVGAYLTIARRHGKEWYLGSMTNSSARKLQLPLRFLGSGRFTAEVYADDPSRPEEPATLVRKRVVVTAGDELPADMSPAGGYVVHLTPAR